MKFSTRFESMLDTLTLEEAQGWDATVEKFTYVTDNILDPNGFTRADRLVYAVEERFALILADADS